MHDFSSALAGTARELLAAGDPRGAEIVCRKLLQFNPDHCETLSLLGVIQHRSGKYQNARDIFEQLLVNDPTDCTAWSNHGVCCLAMDDWECAEESMRHALKLCPTYADAWNNLGVLYDKQSRDCAVDCFRQALQHDPSSVDACNNLALHGKKQQLFNESIFWYQKSLTINPNQPAILYRLAEVLEQTSCADEAVATYQRSLDLHPDDGVRLKQASTLPVIVPSSDSIAEIRDTLRDRLCSLQYTDLSIDRPWEKGRTLFYLAYHGLNDRPFHEQMADIYRAATPGLSWQAPHIGKRRVRGNRVKVGYISQFFYHHTIAKLNIGTIEQLDRRRFEVTVLLIDAGIRDSMTQRFETAADVFVVLPNDFYAMRELIAIQELDVLVYTDIGMEPLSYFLAFSRLAPVQCVTWGHPATSGIDTVDYFISHEDCETDAGRTGYSEKLFCLSRQAACTCYAQPLLPQTDKTRASFGIDSGCHLYYCPQPPFKLHPDFDLLLQGILERDPVGIVILLRGVAQETEDQLKKRLSRVMPDSIVGRIRFMDPLPFADYIAMLKLVDVVLDTPHFSGGNSSLEALAVGAAVVTLPSPFLKGRLTYAWYQRLGIHDGVARTPSEYIDIAVRLGTNRQVREDLQRRILEASPLLFDDLQAVRELEYFFESACHGK